MTLNRYIDHTLLKAAAADKEILQWCEEALAYHFFAVCFNGCHIKLAHEFLKGSDVKLCSVSGFPLGAMSSASKIYEAEQAIHDGADEIDMVMNLGWLKSGEQHNVAQEIALLKKAIGNHTLKVIIETCYLSDEEKKAACRLAVEGGADFVKTSTGFGSGGATFEDIVLMKAAVNGKAQLKASGGIKDAETAKRYIELGVSRLGTSNGIAIVTGESSPFHQY